MADLKILPKRLIEVRKSNGYTRKRLAGELNRPYRTITNYESGEHEPGHKYLIEIAEKFGVTTDYLLGLSDDPRKKSDETKKSPGTAEAASGDKQENEFMCLVHDLRPEHKDFLVAVMKALLGQDK